MNPPSPHGCPHGLCMPPYDDYNYDEYDYNNQQPEDYTDDYSQESNDYYDQNLLPPPNPPLPPPIPPPIQPPPPMAPMGKMTFFPSILDRHQVWRSHDPTSVRLLTFVKKDLSSLFFILFKRTQLWVLYIYFLGSLRFPFTSFKRTQLYRPVILLPVI